MRPLREPDYRHCRHQTNRRAGASGVDIRDVETAELRRLKTMIERELSRRETLANAGRAMDDIARSVLAASGQTDGGEWVQPTDATNAYPKGWTVTHDGKTWVSLTPANVWEPGVSGW